jgi:hypothetical protein
VKEAAQKNRMNSIHLAFSKVLLNKDSGPMKDVFDSCAIAAERILPNCDARSLSNLAYAYALIGYNPQLGKKTLLGIIGDTSIGLMQEFNEQDISNMVWALH